MDASLELRLGQTSARLAILDLIQRWGFCRDQGRWQELADTFHGEGTIAVSWFQGRHSDFIAASRARYGGAFTKHFMAGSTIELGAGRATSETNVILAWRAGLDGVDAVGQAYFRFLDCIEECQGTWRILQRNAIYDSDWATPANPGEPLRLDEGVLASCPAGCRYLAYRLKRGGHPVPADLPAAGSAAERALRGEAARWLAAGAR
jgi:hypothetical protein